MNPRDFTFRGLCNQVGKFEPEPEVPTSLCYLISCVDSRNHAIADPQIAKRILSWLYDMEEQAQNADHLKAGESFFDRYFRGGFHPKTPCLMVEKWSPISALLENQNDPIILERVPRALAIASGIWDPVIKFGVIENDMAPSDQTFFLKILKKVSEVAIREKMFINVIAGPGWSYEHAINSLPDWSVEEVAKAGRLVWKRTFQDES